MRNKCSRWYEVDDNSGLKTGWKSASIIVEACPILIAILDLVIDGHQRHFVDL
jgi:hypothetical protein